MGYNGPSTTEPFPGVGCATNAKVYKEQAPQNQKSCFDDDVQQARRALKLGEDITLNNIDELMRYQPWDGKQIEQSDQVREVLTAAAKAILRNVPAGRFRSVALRNIIDARFNSNAGISFYGRF